MPLKVGLGLAAELRPFKLPAESVEFSDQTEDEIPASRQDTLAHEALAQERDALVIENARLAHEKLMLENAQLAQENAILRQAMCTQRARMLEIWTSCRTLPQQLGYPPAAVPNFSAPERPRGRSSASTSATSVGDVSPTSRKSLASPSVGDASPTSRNSTSNFSDALEWTDERKGALATTPTHSLTTVMLRSIPRNLTRTMLLELLKQQGFESAYDLVYVPMDFKQKAGLGYAFVNLIDHETAEIFRQRFLSGLCGWSTQGERFCDVMWCESLQGVETHIDRYRNSPVMHSIVPDEFKPALFKDGRRVDFPSPTKRLRPPKQWVCK